jgi:hypothetical protein
MIARKCCLNIVKRLSLCLSLLRKKKLIDSHHSDFLDYMSDDIKTTDVLDGFMDLLKAMNSNLNDLKVCWCLFHVPEFQSSGFWTCVL